MSEDVKTLRVQGELIALHLGKPWKFNALRDPSNWSFELIDGHGRGLFFRCEYGASKKYRISGNFSASKTGRHYGKGHSIGVSRSRAAKAIAADITRRLLPDYLAAFDTAVARYHAEKERDHMKELVKAAIIKVAGGQFYAWRDSVSFDDGEAKFTYGDNIELTLRNLTPDQAIRITAMITAERREAKAAAAAENHNPPP